MCHESIVCHKREEGVNRDESEERTRVNADSQG